MVMVVVGGGDAGGGPCAVAARKAGGEDDVYPHTGETQPGTRSYGEKRSSMYRRKEAKGDYT